jgi:MoaA/NifB/PqqE/SkfB family radical SAM enzyme
MIKDIKVMTWFLNRQCNLSCEYCRIAKYYLDAPYPNIYYFNKYQIKYINIVKILDLMKINNPECFHIFMGGEPLLHNDLIDIIKYCNENSILYTIISNGTCTDLLDRFFSEVGEVMGFTTSIDPIIFSEQYDKDRYFKSLYGLNCLLKYKDRIKDPVAEVTCDSRNYKYLIKTLELLTGHGINSVISFVDAYKNKYYDFAGIEKNSDLIVHKTPELKEILEQAKNYNIHMPQSLKILYENLPYNFKCHVQSLDNIVIDADGMVRLCLRIRGLKTPSMTIDEYLMNLDELKNNLQYDQNKVCEGCNWTSCIMTSAYDYNDLIHADKRN